MGLYPVDNVIHEWLGDMTPRWEKLADALYAVQCFLKSQQKIYPSECSGNYLRCVESVARDLSGSALK